MVTPPTPVTLPGVEAVNTDLSKPSDWLDGQHVEAVAIAVAPEPHDGEGVSPQAGAEVVARRYGIDMPDLARRHKLKGTTAQVATVALPRSSGQHSFGWESLPDCLLIVGTGDGAPTDLRRAGAALARSSAGRGTVVMSVGERTDEMSLQALVTGFLLASYRHPWFGQGEPPAGWPAERLVLVGPAVGNAQQAIEDAECEARATCLARHLAAMPSNTKNPQWLAEHIHLLATGVEGVEVTVHDEKWLGQEGFGALLAVGTGSATPPRVVTISYEPPQAASDTVVLVGKGITFDTGGLSIKPREAMAGMKTDMAGAAAVLAATLAAARARVPRKVVAVLPLAENAVGAGAYRPGDIVRAVDGTTIEVTNTDAEGRMVLADALAWARISYEPEVMIDVATLTGAATLGLGRGHAALYSSDEELASELAGAGADTGEEAWRMPLVADYRTSLSTPVADLCHQSTDPTVSGGSIIAALFLQHFAGQTRWAHLDIAGAGRATAAKHELPEGPTGYGARLLLRWLTAHST